MAVAVGRKGLPSRAELWSAGRVEVGGEEQSVAVASLRWPRGWRPARCGKSTAGAAARGRGADTDIFQDSKQLCMTTREKCLEEPENNLLPLKLSARIHTIHSYTLVTVS